MGKTNKTPKYHAINFFRDSDNGCALTVRVNYVRFHTIVDQQYLRDRSDAGKTIASQYRQLLQHVKDEEDNVDECGNPVRDEDTESEDDSGIDVPSTPNGKKPSSGANSEAHERLYEWIMAPMIPVYEKETSRAKTDQKHTVQEWYNTPVHFFHLEIKDGSLVCEKESRSDSLDKRMQALIPNLSMPKYIRNLQIPTFAATDLVVETESTDPCPIHPATVRVGDDLYFLKVVDMFQPQPFKREIRLMKQIESKGLHGSIRMPLVRGLVQFEGSSGTMGFIMDVILGDPTPMTQMLDPNIPQEKRERWAAESRRMLDVLHEHGIVWGDAKGDNFLVDKDDQVWMIDFGGMWTQGWVDPELNETEAGDEQGMRKLENALMDPQKNTFNPGGSSAEPAESGEQSRGSKRKRSATQTNDSGSSKQPRVSRPPCPFEEEPKEDESENSDGSDGEEQRYCYCGGTEAGEMIACDNEACETKWFHFSCLGIEKAPSTKQWYCDPCKDNFWKDFNHGP